MTSRKSVSGTLKQEINQARSNLDSLLQKISEKRDGSPVASDDENQPKSTIREITEQSPKKRSSQTGKKRKRAQEIVHNHPESSSTSSTHVVKLFDRSVDLAPFSDGAALYPICRSWMRNTASDQRIEHIPQQTATIDVDDQYQLAPPIKYSTGEDLKELRIPQPIRDTSCPPLDLNAVTLPRPEQLLLNHLAHWKHVRQSWKLAAAKYESRYEKSLSHLKDMHEGACKA